MRMVDDKVGINSQKNMLSGYVYSKSQAILNGVKVTCGDFETLTLADGYYTLNELPTGILDVTVNLKGYQSTSKKVTIKENEHTVQDFILNKASGTASIKGNIRDSETNEPIRNKGTVILILPISNSYIPIDKNGYYEFDNLPKGTYAISTSIPEYDDSAIVLTLLDGECKLHDFSCKKNRDVEPAWG